MTSTTPLPLIPSTRRRIGTTNIASIIDNAARAITPALVFVTAATLSPGVVR